ncbi:MAG: preprotein translocase subunit YajC [Flavobacteriales bacterium]|nr:preprotein translocase subunit YajC [Flavobacteriales bacterium]
MNANILLQAQPGAGGGPQFWIRMGLLMVVFYFFMIRPQQKKAKDAKKFRESLQKGARVVTIGGIHGRIVEVADTTILLEVDSNVKLRFERSAIAMDNTQQLTEATAKAQ